MIEMISHLSPFKAAAIITMIRALIKLDGRTQEPVLPSLVLQGLNTYQASSPIYWPWRWWWSWQMIIMMMLTMPIKGNDIQDCFQAALTSIDPGLNFATMFQEALFRWVAQLFMIWCGSILYKITSNAQSWKNLPFSALEPTILILSWWNTSKR